MKKSLIDVDKISDLIIDLMICHIELFYQHRFIWILANICILAVVMYTIDLFFNFL